MSAEVKREGRLTSRDIVRRKGGLPLVVLTAYTAPMARLLDPHVDILLVGDSLANVIYGMDTTIGVTLDMMIAHGRAVVRTSSHACVVIDMPFGSYQESPEQAFRNAARVMGETGASAIKLEGGVEMTPTIRFLVERGVPVMGHVGLRPQLVHTDGGYRAKGREEAEVEAIVADAKAVSEAGAFSIVIEATVEPLSRRLTAEVAVPTIGIGASAACDGQVLVIDDMLGLSGLRTAKFVKRYTQLSEQIEAAVKSYAEEVQARQFPGPEHVYGAPR